MRQRQVMRLARLYKGSRWEEKRRGEVLCMSIYLVLFLALNAEDKIDACTYFFLNAINVTVQNFFDLALSWYKLSNLARLMKISVMVLPSSFMYPEIVVNSAFHDKLRLAGSAPCQNFCMG